MDAHPPVPDLILVLLPENSVVTMVVTSVRQHWGKSATRESWYVIAGGGEIKVPVQDRCVRAGAIGRADEFSGSTSGHVTVKVRAADHGIAS